MECNLSVKDLNDKLSKLIVDEILFFTLQLKQGQKVVHKNVS